MQSVSRTVHLLARETVFQLKTVIISAAHAHKINLKRDVAVKTISEEMLKELEEDPEEMEIAFKQRIIRIKHLFF
jgi:hypothetical protein